MFLGSIARVDCDREDCIETGQIPFTMEENPTGEQIQKVFAENGWYLSGRGMFCYRHKPKDWDGPSFVRTPPELARNL